jgi:hypothetical protein
LQGSVVTLTFATHVSARTAISFSPHAIRAFTA